MNPLIQKIATAAAFPRVKKVKAAQVAKNQQLPKNKENKK